MEGRRNGIERIKNRPKPLGPDLILNLHNLLLGGESLPSLIIIEDAYLRDLALRSVNIFDLVLGKPRRVAYITWLSRLLRHVKRRGEEEDGSPGIPEGRASLISSSKVAEALSIEPTPYSSHSNETWGKCL